MAGKGDFQEPQAARNLAVSQEGSAARFLARLGMAANGACRILIWADMRWLESGRGRQKVGASLRYQLVT
jgi:hypothetical protein